MGIKPIRIVQAGTERSRGLSHPIVNRYEEACQVIEELGVVPLSSFIPGHPSLVSITQDAAWHTGNGTDPWLWRDRFAGEGVAAYGRFLAGKPLLISREIFPLVRCLLAPSETVADRYAAGNLSRPAARIYRAWELSKKNRLCMSYMATARDRHYYTSPSQADPLSM